MERTVSVRLRAVTSGFAQAMRGAAGSMGAVRANADNLVSVGTTMSKTLTPALVAIGTHAVWVGSQFESSMSGVSAVTQATEGELASMSDTAQELGRTTQFSASQAAEALEFLGMAGFSATEATEALPDVLNLAAAGGMDLARSADLASNVLGQFGLEVDQTARVADVLAETARNSNTSVEQLGQGLQMAGPVANAAGLEIEETAAAMGLMGDAGIQASQAGTSLRGAMTRLLNASGPAADTLRRLGINAEQADGSLQPLPDVIDQLGDSGATAGDLMEIFGQRAGPAMAALVNQGGDALRDLTATLDDSTGAAAEQASERMDNLSGDLQRLRSAAEGAGIAFYEAGIGDALRGLAQTGADALQAVSELPDPLVRTGVAVGGVAAAAGPAITAVGMLAQQGPKLVSAFSAGKTTMRGFGRFLMGPWGAALAAGAAAYIIFQHNTRDTEAAVQSLRTELDGATADFDSLSDEFLVSHLRSEDALTAWRDLGLGLDVLRGYLTGSAEDIEAVHDAQTEAARSGTTLSGTLHEATFGIAGTRDEYAVLGAVLEELSEGTDEYNRVLAAQDEVLGRNTDRLDNHSDRMPRNTSLTEDNAGAHRDLAGAMEEVTDQADTLTDALDTLAGRQMDVNETQRNWLDGLDDLKESIKENGDTLDINTEAGRANQRQLDSSIEAAFEHGQAMLDNGESVDDATEAVLGMIEQLPKQASEYGLTQEKAEEYIEALGLTPEDIITLVAIETDQAYVDIADFRESGLGSLPSSVTIPIRVSHPGESVGQVHSDPARRGGAGRRVNHLGGPAGQGPIRYHSGGLASDEIPAILQRGEYVMQRSAVAQYGPELMGLINAGRMHAGGQVAMASVASSGTSAGVDGRAVAILERIAAGVEAGRDVVVKVDSVEVARANEVGTRQLERRR